MCVQILIIGPRHSGKSECARALAKITGGIAVDLDKLVESQSGKTPRELYESSPGSFMEAEAEALASVIMAPGQNDAVCHRENLSLEIVSTGGGLVDNARAMALLSKAKSLNRRIAAVYLDVSADTAWNRIADAAAKEGFPPFLKTGNPKESHLVLHRRRADACKAFADFTVSAENKTSMEIAAEITDWLNRVRF